MEIVRDIDFLDLVKLIRANGLIRFDKELADIIGIEKTNLTPLLV